MIIRFMKSEDIEQASLVHKQAFSRQTNSREWLQCSLNAHPRHLCFVAETGTSIVGYIIWSQKSGFRNLATVELDQIAVLPEFQNRGIGKKLIKESMQSVQNELETLGSTIKNIIVSTRSDNYAQKIYRDTLGAEVTATIPSLYSSDEVIMLATIA